jgi:hypothetical protein
MAGTAHVSTALLGPPSAALCDDLSGPYQGQTRNAQVSETSKAENRGNRNWDLPGDTAHTQRVSGC